MLRAILAYLLLGTVPGKPGRVVGKAAKHRAKRALLVCIDHYYLEAWAEVVKVGDRVAALEPIRLAVRERFGGFRAHTARDFQLRPDHGSQYMSDHFLGGIRWLGMASSPALVGEPEGNGVAEWCIRQLQEQVRWTRRLLALDAARPAVRELVDRFSREWLVERLAYRSPREAYAAFLPTRGVAA